MTDHLFDPDSTTERTCPVPDCTATLQPHQPKAIECDYDRNRDDYRRRPTGCLNAHDPRYADIGF